MKTKFCPNCRTEKIIKEFTKNKSRKDGLNGFCKSCNKIYRENNKEKRKVYSVKNKEQILKQQKHYYNFNQKRWKIYREKYKQRVNKYLKQRRDNDLNFRLETIYRNRINTALRQNSKKSRTLELLGCSIEFLKEHLQKQFKGGMTWDNYGLWHIDHIRPCNSFDLSKAEEQAKCFNYINLQPLWAIENLEKSDKILTGKE
jgi:ribosomal protein L20